MWRIATFLILAISCPAQSRYQGSATAQVLGNGVISAPLARRVGLVRAWSNQVEVNRAGGRVQSAILHVSESQTFTVFEVTAGDRKAYFSSRELGNRGEPLAVAGAQQRARDLIETYKALGREPQLETLTVADATLYIQTTTGLLNAIDAETGRTRWTIQLGNPNYPSSVPGVSEKYVASINGSTVYLIDAMNGKIKWERTLDRMTGAGPAVTNNLVVVPSYGGALEAYPIDDPSGQPTIYSSAGHVMVQPTVSRQSLSWPTDRGFLYVSAADSLDLRFRLKTRRPIVSPTTRQPPNLLFAAATDGYVYALNEMNGDTLWRHALGLSVSQSPVPIGESLYVITDYDGMYSLASKTGERQWWAPSIRRFIAASTGRVYVMTDDGTMAVFDAKSGERLGGVSALGVDLVLTNTLTDRIYVGNSSGMIQCLHETQLPWPHRHVIEPSVDEGPLDAPPQDEESQRQDPGTGIPAQEDPFRIDEAADDAFDPFGGDAGDGANNALDTEDNSDPFGQDADDDPFN